jgi:hypothetical protein
MTRIATTHYRYKRPPRQRKAATLEVPAVVRAKATRSHDTAAWWTPGALSAGGLNCDARLQVQKKPDCSSSDFMPPVCRVFGHPYVQRRAPKRDKNAASHCRCDNCGGAIVAVTERLLLGATRSCGCLLYEPHPIRGMKREQLTPVDFPPALAKWQATLRPGV